MKLIIFGASGGTGKELVKQALQLNHHVTAFTRHPEKLSLRHKNLDVMSGDALNKLDVVEAIHGKDAVLCSLGMQSPRDKSFLRANATINIIDAMKKQHVSRFVCQSALGSGDSQSTLPFFYKYIVLPFLLRQVFKDHNLQEKHIQNSDLNWTLVRPSVLTDGKLSGKYWSGEKLPHQPFRLKISRADVAEFMIKQLSSDQYIKNSVAITC